VIMRKLRPLLVIAFVLSCIISLASLAAAQQTTLNVGIYREPITMDPHVGVGNDAKLMYLNIYEPLVAIDKETFELVPHLATDWNVSEDGLTYRFSLRKGVTFNDGTPFNAEAVRVNIERIQALKTGPYWLVDKVVAVDPIDEMTVEFQLSEPFSPFLAGLTQIFYASPSAIVDHDEGDQARGWLATHTVGTGPYTLADYSAGSQWTLRQNADYWGGWANNQPTEINLVVVLEASTQRLMLQNGDLDVALLYSLDALPELRNNPNITVAAYDVLAQYYIRFQNQAGLTADKRVRQALSAAWDYEVFSAVMPEAGEPGDGPVPSELLGGEVVEVPYGFDLERAKELLEEAGVRRGTTLTYLYNTGDELKRIQGELFQAQLAQLGLRLNIEEQAWAAMQSSLERYGETRAESDVVETHNFFLDALVPDTYFILYRMYHSDTQGSNGYNLSYYANPIVDDLIDRAAATSDPAAARELYRQANEQIAQDYPGIYLSKMRAFVLLRSDVTGFNPLRTTQGHISYFELRKQ
jgi:peptide/nickel transport system substrate-binding protein